MNTQEQQLPPLNPQIHAAAPPGVTVNQQTDAAPPPVVVVNQAMGNRFFTKRPYFIRGAKFSNGCRCGGRGILMLFTFGGFMIFLGLVNSFLRLQFGIFMLIIGGTMVGLGVYFLRTAKAQFNSLPPDHPDRVTYTAPYVLVTPSRSQGRGDQPGYTYTVPLMQQQVMSHPSPPGVQVMYYPAQPIGQGQAFLPPYSATNHAPSTPVTYSGPIPPGAGAAPGYPRSLQGSYVPENDPPPAYSDVVKDA